MRFVMVRAKLKGKVYLRGGTEHEACVGVRVGRLWAALQLPGIIMATHALVT